MRALMMALTITLLGVFGAAAQSNADIAAQLAAQKKFNALPLTERQRILAEGVKTVDELNALEAAPPAAPDNEPTFLDKMNEIDATHDEPCGLCDPITPATPDGTYILPRGNGARAYDR